jgi:hypothetical protein
VRTLLVIVEEQQQAVDSCCSSPGCQLAGEFFISVCCSYGFSSRVLVRYRAIAELQK